MPEPQTAPAPPVFRAPTCGCGHTAGDHHGGRPSHALSTPHRGACRLCPCTEYQETDR